MIGAFFIACVLLGDLVLAQDCVLPPAVETVHIKYVFDGDTLQLKDGRKVRLLGINTPELDHEGGAHEPLALEARQYLQRLIGQAKSIGLYYSEQRRDRYKRVLAHIILDGDIDVQQRLLQQGLAFAIAIPPDLFNQSCYQQVENMARKLHRGVWGEPYYKSLSLDVHAPDRSGFRLLNGTVRQVSVTASAVWLRLNSRVTLRIDSKDMVNFSRGESWDQLRGRFIQARGWLYRKRHQWRMKIHHPQNLIIEPL